jgi:hypothetical protein
LKASKAISSATAPAAKASTNADSSSNTDDRFRLSGPSRRLDPRTNAFRDDLADIALAGRILAPHYARPLARACGAHAAFVRPGPTEQNDAISELLPGEDFAVLEYAGGWAWGYCGADRVVGYVEAIALAAPLAPTHIVCEKCAPVAADDRITSPVLASLPMGARLHGEEHGACLTTEYGCVSLSHLRRIEEHDLDPVLVAERLMGTPYLRGGRSFNGVDGAGLVQLALALCGIAAPRFADQLRGLGDAVPDDAPSRRGDIILRDGDAGLMTDDLMMIHAAPAAGRVTVGPVGAIADQGVQRRRL